MKESPVHELRIGCIADDFTGGGDAASFLAGGGLKTLLLIWTFSCEHLPEDCDAVVIALKSRSVPADQAVADSLAAINWLQAHHARKLYFKYCSTFDSTPRGNIGPVSDALLETLEQPYTVLCPSLLSNGRAVRDGVLYVNGIPLAQSPMRSHPLNPMWNSDIRVLMQAQSRYPCFVVPEALCRDPAALAGRIHALQQKHRHFYLIPDYFEPTHGAEIARAFAPLPLWTGGSELLLHFARQVSGRAADASLVPPMPAPRLGRVMLAGSCSVMSRLQIRNWIEAGGRAEEIGPEMVFESAPAHLALLRDRYLQAPQQDILYYASPRTSGREGLAQAFEAFSAALAAELVRCAPVERLLVAGGETSGAVIRKLGYRAFRIGESLSPGVPVLYPAENPRLRIVLKSGNFGGPDFFLTTLKE